MNASSLYPGEKPYYKQPEALPAGFLEVVQPLAAWFFKQLVQAYDEGYTAGRSDAGYLALQREKRNRRPPTGGAVVTPA